MCTIYSSYLTVIVVHEMHGRMHHNHCQITNLLAHDLLSSFAYPMTTHPLPLASNKPIKTLVIGFNNVNGMKAAALCTWTPMGVLITMHSYIPLWFVSCPVCDGTRPVYAALCKAMLTSFICVVHNTLYYFTIVLQYSVYFFCGHCIPWIIMCTFGTASTVCWLWAVAGQREN